MIQNSRDYTDWLFNRYVETRISPVGRGDYRVREFAYEALVNHLQANMQGRVKAADRNWAKLRLKELRELIKENKDWKFDYVGRDAQRLRDRDQQLKDLVRNSFSEERISMPGKTELSALKLVGKMVLTVDRFQKMCLDRTDDAYLCGALNHLLRILQANGYKLADDQKKNIVKVL